MMDVLVIGLLGLLVGSFLNVVIHRLPRDESVVFPSSRCPSCGAAIKPYDNVPVLSWLALRGRCRGCATAISARYPLVELGTGILWIAVALTADDALALVLGLLLVTALVPLALIDLDRRLLPNRIVGPAAAAAVLSTPEGDVLDETSLALGRTTNNVAEYRGLLLGLERARELGAREVEVVNDSELVARQIGGQYKVKHAGLKPLYEDAMEALRGFDGWAVRSVRREQNTRADELVNEALDEALRA